MKVFSADFLNQLSSTARGNPRKRQHSNIHQDYSDPCQRLFNAIEPDSYIRPHRHFSDPRSELLIAIRGCMALVIFDEHGAVEEVERFGVQKEDLGLAIGAEVPSSTWHTVVALEPGCVLLEVKAGPFDPGSPKNFAPWAPTEGASGSANYLKMLVSTVEQRKNLAFGE